MKLNKSHKHKGHHKHKIGIRQTQKINKGRGRKGGEALASGGFGCIFKPALRCKGSETRINGVSKMSLERHGKQEMLEIGRIKDKLKKIKNYQTHYLLDVEMCVPEKLTSEDMKQFDKKITLAITGASGSAYALRLLECLLAANYQVYLLCSRARR